MRRIAKLVLGLAVFIVIHTAVMTLLILYCVDHVLGGAV
jgi:hypothetical protein